MIAAAGQGYKVEGQRLWGYRAWVTGLYSDCGVEGLRE